MASLLSKLKLPFIRNALLRQELPWLVSEVVLMLILFNANAPRSPRSSLALALGAGLVPSLELRERRLLVSSIELVSMGMSLIEALGFGLESIFNNVNANLGQRILCMCSPWRPWLCNRKFLLRFHFQY